MMTCLDHGRCVIAFGIAGALLPTTLTNTTIAFTPREYTGISSATTNMMRIIGGAIGPVLTTVILASVTISITVDNVEKSYPSPITFNIVFGLGVCNGNCMCVPIYHNETPRY